MALLRSIDTRHVTARWDSEAQVWWAESDDIAGLATEAGTLDDLVARCGAAIGELLAANGASPGEVPVEYRVLRSSGLGSAEDRMTVRTPIPA